MTEITLGERRGDLVEVFLIPVEVFGAECSHHDDALDDDCRGWGYGLMDADDTGSDCNRAIGHVYRLADTPILPYHAGQYVSVFVREADLPWFLKRWGDRDSSDGAYLAARAEAST